MRSIPCRIIQLLGIAHPVEGKLFQVPKVHLGMGCIRGLRDEEMVIYGLVMYFVKMWVKDPVLDNCKLTHFCIKYTFLLVWMYGPMWPYYSCMSLMV